MLHIKSIDTLKHIQTLIPTNVVGYFEGYFPSIHLGYIRHLYPIGIVGNI